MCKHGISAFFPEHNKLLEYCYCMVARQTINSAHCL